jgi:glycolate oxidase
MQTYKISSKLLISVSAFVVFIFLNTEICADDPSIIVDVANATVTCKDMSITIKKLEDEIKRELKKQLDKNKEKHPEYYDLTPDFGPEKTISVENAIYENAAHINKKILELKVTTEMGNVTLGGKTQKNDSGLNAKSLFCGLDDLFGGVIEVTFTLRNKGIIYPATSQLDATQGVNTILTKISKLITNGIPSSFNTKKLIKPNAIKSLREALLNAGIKATNCFVISSEATEKTKIEYYKDWEVGSPSPNAPLLIVFPKNTAEVAMIINAANKFNIPWLARGAGTSLTGSSVPMKSSVIIDLSQMTTIGSFVGSENTATIVAEAGALNINVKKYAEECGWRFSPKPASFYMSSIGGNLANNAVGINGAKEGATGDYVNAATFVTAEGNILTLRRFIPEERVILDLLAGSEGRLGIFTELELVLLKQNKKTKTYTLLFKFDSNADAITAVQNVLKTGIVPETIEFMDSSAVEAINSVKNIQVSGQTLAVDKTNSYNNAVAVVLIRVTDTNNSTAEKRKELVKNALLHKTCIEADVTNEEDIMNTRLYIYLIVTEYMKLKGTSKHLDMDPIIPVSKGLEFYNYIKSISSNIPVFCHAGDMLFHPLIFYKDDYTSCVNALKTMKKIDEQAASLEFKGQMSGEHGIGFKLSYLLNPEPPDSMTNEVVAFF